MIFDSSAGARDVKDAQPANYAASEKKGQKNRLSESTVYSSATLARRLRIFHCMPMTSEPGPLRSASVGRNLLLRSLAVSLAFLWAVNPAEADTFSMVAVQDFDGVAVKDGDDGTGEIICLKLNNETHLLNRLLF